MRSTSFLIRSALLLCLALMLALAGSARAGTLTLAPAGTVNVSNDTVNGVYTALPTLTYVETANNDIGTGTLTITAPIGYQFDTTVGVARLTASTNATASNNTNGLAVGSAFTMNRQPGSFSITISATSQGNTRNTIQWTGMAIRPTAATPLGIKYVTIAIPNFAVANAVTLNLQVGVTKLFTGWPGQVFTPGTGPTGAISPVTAGTAANMVLYAANANNNIVTTYSGTQTVSFAGPASCFGSNPIYTTSVTFVNGQATIPTTFFQAGATTLTSTIATITTSVPSTTETVSPGTTNRMFVTLPGQTFTPCVGNSGTVSAQYASTPFDFEYRSIDAYYNVTELGAPAGRNITGPSGTNSYINMSTSAGVTTVRATINTAQTTTVTVTGTSPAVTGIPSSSLTLTVLAEGFNAFDPAFGLPNYAATTGYIYTKRVGDAFTLHMVARKSGGALANNFLGQVSAVLVDASGAGTCTSWPAIAGTTQTVTFTNANQGRLTMAPYTVNTSYRKVAVRMTSLAGAPPVGCSIDFFAIRPDNFLVAVTDDGTPLAAGTTRSLVTTPGTNNAVTHKAGRPFRLAVTARNFGNTAVTNYLVTPSLTTSACATATACPATIGTLTPGTWSGSAGVQVSTTASYSDVGYLTVTAQDTTFAIVDAGDPNITTADRYITGSSTIGRFIPDHYKVSDTEITNRLIANCGAATPSEFSYMGEALQATFKLTANNFAGNPTVNYSGTYAGTANLVKLDPTSSSFLNYGAADTAVPMPLLVPITGITKANPGQVTTGQPHRLSTGTTVYLSGIGGMTELNNTTTSVVVVDANNFRLSGTNSNTTAFTTFVSGGSVSRLAMTGASASTWASGVTTVTSTLSFSRQLLPDGPFDALDIGILPLDTDAVGGTGFDLNADGDALSTLERISLGTTKMRFGRLALRPAYGSQLINLRVPVLAQYYNGSSFVTNTDDNCTTLLTTHAALSDWTGGVTSTNLPQTKIQSVGVFSSGASFITIGKPTNPVPTTRGSALIEVNLGPTGANLSYFLGNWVPGGTYISNPRTRATFGNYSPTPVIYMREVF
ncbi:MAG: DUF6701 domain-containing protein [Pseudomonadota bacterium]